MSTTKSKVSTTSQKTYAVYSLEGHEVKTIQLPKIFQTPYRPDVIKRAVLSARTARQQAVGRDPMAGRKTSAENWGIGRGAARVPRVKGNRHPAAAAAAFVPFVVGGRVTHPPMVRDFTEKINFKERHLAIRSAIASTIDPQLIEFRGHIVERVIDLPLILTNEFEAIATTKDVEKVFDTIGVSPDVAKARMRKTKVRAGKGKRRGRKYKTAKSVLIVYGEDKGIFKAARNLPGVDVCRVDQLNAEILAPGTHAGRLTIWTENALQTLNTKELYW